MFKWFICLRNTMDDFDTRDTRSPDLRVDHAPRTNPAPHVNHAHCSNHASSTLINTVQANKHGIYFPEISSQPTKYDQVSTSSNVGGFTPSPSVPSFPRCKEVSLAGGRGVIVRGRNSSLTCRLDHCPGIGLLIVV